MMDKELEALAKKVDNLSFPDKLRLAAELLAAGRPNLGLDIAQRVVQQLAGARALGRLVEADMRRDAKAKEVGRGAAPKEKP